MSKSFDEKWSNALLKFNQTAVLYCREILDGAAHDYAMDYVRILQSRARGLDAAQPRIPGGPFEPDGKLIQSMLESMYNKCFPPA
jgi:hypothetical protein